MNNWQIKKLAEIAVFRKGKLMPNSSIQSDGSSPYILIDDLRSGKYSHFTPSTQGTTCVMSDSLIVWDGAYAGTVGGGLSGFVGSTITKISPREEVDPNFLRMFLSSKFKEFNRQTHGAAVPHLNKEFVLNYPIPLPSINVQKQIVEKLDAIRKLQNLKNLEIDKSEELLKSLLIFEFKPLNNWTTKKLPEVAKVQRGKFTPRPRNDPKYFGGDIPWIQTGNITNSTGIISSYSQTLNKRGLEVSRLFPKGTIVVTIAANIGDFAILGIDAAFPDSVVGIKVDNSIVDNQFLYYQLLKTKNYLNQQATQAAQKNINLQVLSTVTIAFPSLKEQKEIVKKLNLVLEYKNIIKMKRDKLSELFESTLNKLTKGETVN